MTQKNKPRGKQEEYIQQRKIKQDGKQKIIYGYCPECYNKKYIYDHHHGECVCPTCGLVITENTNHLPHTPPHTKNINIQKTYTPQEKEYIKKNKLHIPLYNSGNNTRYAHNWRLINQYATRLNIYQVDRINIYNFMKNENLSTLHIKRNKIILSIMKYLISNRPHQNKRIDRGVFREEKLTTQEYRRVLKYLFHHDTQKYGIVRKEDKIKKYYQWIWT